MKTIKIVILTVVIAILSFSAGVIVTNHKPTLECDWIVKEGSEWSCHVPLGANPSIDQSTVRVIIPGLIPSN